MTLSAMKQSDIYIVLLDISGYTKFSRGHGMAQMHAEKIISELLEAVIAEMDSPLVINKLEGDAILAYATAEDNTSGRKILSQLPDIIDGFMARRDELIYCSMCVCNMCRSLGDLQLKAFVHKGPAILKEVAGHKEIAGDSVIFAHRLMKNSVEGDEYILLSEDAAGDISPPAGFVSQQVAENVESYGRTNLTVWHRIETLENFIKPQRSFIGAKWQGLKFAIELDAYWFKRRFMGASKVQPKL